MNKEDILKILEGAKDKNGDVPMRLVRQAFEKLPEPCTDTISRQMAINALRKCSVKEVTPAYMLIDKAEVMAELMQLPSAQPERDIPMKPIETTDRAWGIPLRQAVCPKCDYYLGHVAFLSDYKGKRITYCETCGQAIDWEGWDFDE